MFRFAFKIRTLLIVVAACACILAVVRHLYVTKNVFVVDSNCSDCLLFIDDQCIGRGRAELTRADAMALGLTGNFTNFQPRHHGVYLLDSKRFDGSAPRLYIVPDQCRDVETIGQSHGLPGATVLLSSTNYADGACRMFAFHSRSLPKSAQEFFAIIETYEPGSLELTVACKIRLTSQLFKDLTIDSSQGIHYGVNAISLIDGRCVSKSWKATAGVAPRVVQEFKIRLNSPDEKFVYYARIVPPVGGFLPRGGPNYFAPLPVVKMTTQIQ
ncbi:MAG TPA: hypothetical protein VL096_01955 [Pirellulaceae bacterium]|nr:hypothetical protein [Pirellulaceae bacterium]